MLDLTMTGRLSQCLLLSYRTPARSVQDLLPAGLELVTRDGWAFWNIVACRVDALRPAGLPAALGLTYHHVAYRLHARTRLASGNPLAGLYFVRSDADNNFVTRLGALLTDFRLHRARIRLRRVGAAVSLDVPRSTDPRGDVRLLAAEVAAPVRPRDSIFTSPEEAATFLRYAPLAFTVNTANRTEPGSVSPEFLRLTEVQRDESRWHEHPLEVVYAHFGLFLHLAQTDAHLEHAVCIDPIAYRWRLGRRVRLAPAEQAQAAPRRELPTLSPR